MTWSCPCPRCRLIEWDFSTGDPTGPEWQRTYQPDAWTLTPNIASHDGGYRLYVKGANIWDAALTVPIRDRYGNEFTITIGLDAGPNSQIILTIGRQTKFTLATGRLNGNATAVTITLCRSRNSQAIMATATFYDADGQQTGHLAAPIGLTNTEPPDDFFGQPTAYLPIPLNYVAIDTMHSEQDTCCPQCRGDLCQRADPYRTTDYPLALYGHNHLHANVEWLSTTPDWVIFLLGTCCDDGNGGMLGDILEIDVALGLKNVQLRFYNCGSYHGTEVVNLPFDAAWPTLTTPETWSVDLCLRPNQNGIELSISIAGPQLTGGHVTRQLYTDWTYWHKQCWPEFDGPGNPADIITPASIFAFIHPNNTAIATVDVCACFPLRSSGTSPDCVSIICDETPPPNIAAIAHLTNLQGAGADRNGTYVLETRCDTPTTTESTAAAPDPRPADDPFIRAAVLNWLNQNMPGLTDPFSLPFYCDHNYCETTPLNPIGWDFFRLSIHWPARIDPIFEYTGAIPILAVATIQRHYWKGNLECDTAAQALFIGLAPWPLCPTFPAVTLNPLAHRERRCPAWTAPENCDDNCDQPLAAITGGTVTLNILPL